MFLKPISLRLLLVVPFVLQISAAVGLTGYLSWRNGQEAVQDLAGQLREEVSDRIGEHLDHYLNIPQSLVDSQGIAFDVGLWDLQDSETLRLSFWHQVKTHQISYLLLGFETGEFLSVGHFFGDDRISTEQILQATPEAGGILYSRLLDDQGQPSQITHDLGQFITREEGWYQEAIKQNRRTWSPVYNWTVEPYNLSIAMSQPLYSEPDPEGKRTLIGALAAEQQLTDISHFLRNLDVSVSAKTFIMEPNGLLIGSSAGEQPFLLKNGQPQRLRAKDSDDSLIRASAEFLEDKFPSFVAIEMAQQLEFENGGERQFVQVTPWRDELGLDWLVVVVMPEADFMAQIQANARRTWLLCGVALLVATGMGIYTSHWITGPIKRLSEAAEAIAEQAALDPKVLELNAPIFQPTALLDNQTYRFKELGLMSGSFRRMAEQLQVAFGRLSHTATHDALTGLPNRYALETLLAARLETQVPLALLFLDLDYFKLVNDSLGHGVGDRLLQAVAHRLLQSLSAGDVVARFGGDEFVLLLAPQPGKLMSAHGVATAERVIEQLQKPFSLAQRDVFIGTSIGIVTGQQLSQDNRTVQDFLRSADTALYRAKAQGKGQHAIFDITMYGEMTQRLQLETDLRHAIQQEQLSLHYQPVVDSWSGQISGFEALLRWWNPRSQSMISPSEFIPIAEETGLILPLTEWVLREACQQMRAWQMAFALGDELVMHINVPSQQFLQPQWVESLKHLMTEINLSPRCLGLEITERTLMTHRELMQLALGQLAELGIQVSIDDFGTGYSSLSYLQEFSIHTLKIDRSFVQPLEKISEQGTVESGGIVRAIVAMAHTLGLDVVAEGVETEVQQQVLMQMGCQQMQGYYFAKPASAEEIGCLLAEQQGVAPSGLEEARSRSELPTELLMEELPQVA